MDFPANYGSDFVYVDMKKNPDYRPSKGRDEWNALWENIGISRLGEVKDYPLKKWEDFNFLHIPDVKEDFRWIGVKEKIDQNRDKFILAFGMSIYERVHFLRGLENTWIDIYENTSNLCDLIDLLTEMNIYMKRYAKYGADSFNFSDDWGLQKSLMILPDKWRNLETKIQEDIPICT